MAVLLKRISEELPLPVSKENHSWDEWAVLATYIDGRSGEDARDEELLNRMKHRSCRGGVPEWHTGMHALRPRFLDQPSRLVVVVPARDKVLDEVHPVSEGA